MKNHEGYSDPTAGKAIRRSVRKREKKRKQIGNLLTYELKEVKSFRKAMKTIME